MSLNIPEASAYRQNVTQTFQHLTLLTAFGDVATAALLKEFIHRLSILQDKSKSNLQVEIDIACVIVPVFHLLRFVSFHFALWRRPSHVSSSVAQLEELQAECDKELNNARLMGDPLPSPSSCKP